MTIGNIETIWENWTLPAHNKNGTVPHQIGTLQMPKIKGTRDIQF